jgi:Flp pilus assembly pilin Flp
LYLAEEVAILGTLLQYYSPLTLAHCVLQIGRIFYEENLLRHCFADYADYAQSTSTDPIYLVTPLTGGAVMLRAEHRDLRSSARVTSARPSPARNELARSLLAEGKATSAAMRYRRYRPTLYRRGATALEYALIASVVIVAVAAGARPIGQAFGSIFANLVAAFP